MGIHGSLSSISASVRAKKMKINVDFITARFFHRTGRLREPVLP